MISIEKSIVINKPVEEVFAYVTDGSKASSWQAGVEAVENPTTVVGSQFTEVRKFLGQEMRSVLEITAFEPNAQWAARVLKGPVPYDVSVRFAPLEGGTRLIFRVDGEPTGFFKVAQGMVNSQLEKSMEADLARLKGILERA